jgi:hypothetical protein
MKQHRSPGHIGAIGVGSIPRQLSVRDEGYDHDLGRALAIYLDGKMMDKVIAYDMDEGTVLEYVSDDRGSYVIDADGEAATQTLRGEVTVRYRDDTTA